MIERKRCLEDALLPDGEPADVTKIELELLDDGRWRWRLMAADGPLVSAVAELDELKEMVVGIAMIVQAMSRSATAEAGGASEAIL